MILLNITQKEIEDALDKSEGFRAAMARTVHEMGEENEICPKCRLEQVLLEEIDKEKLNDSIGRIDKILAIKFVRTWVKNNKEDFEEEDFISLSELAGAKLFVEGVLNNHGFTDPQNGFTGCEVD